MSKYTKDNAVNRKIKAIIRPYCIFTIMQIEISDIISSNIISITEYLKL